MRERCDWGSPSSRKEAGHCVNMVHWRELKLSDAMHQFYTQQQRYRYLRRGTDTYGRWGCIHWRYTLDISESTTAVTNYVQAAHYTIQGALRAGHKCFVL